MKQSLRKIAKEKRNTLDCSTLSKKVLRNLCSCDFYKNAQNIMCYYSIGNEVSTLELFSNKTKKWYLPRVDDENLLVCPYDKDKLVEGKYKIIEPATMPVSDSKKLDLVIIPAVCADKKGYRLGYGKGYYDRFLKKLPKSCLRVILTYSELLFDDVFHDSFDEKSDYVITDNFVYKI